MGPDFVGNLKSGKWHYLVVHVKPAFGVTRKVDLYVNCERVSSMQSRFSYQNAYGDGKYEMTIGQRGLRNLAVAKWRVSFYFHLHSSALCLIVICCIPIILVRNIKSISCLTVIRLMLYSCLTAW